MKTLKDRILLHQTVHTRSVSTGITTGEVTAILANAPIHIKE